MGRIIITGLLLLLIVETHHGASLHAAPMHCSVFTSDPKSQASDTSTVATINGEPVTLREFMLHARSLRSLVISEYKIRFGVEYNGGFWTHNFGGKTPLEALKTRTLDTLISVKIQQLSARKAGIVSDISYQGFLAALDTENVRRLAAKQSGKVIYGPVQYSEEVYYNYLFSSMVNSLKESLSQSRFDITEAKLKEAFEKEKDSLFQLGYYTRVQLIRLKTDDNVGSNDKKVAIEDDRTTLIFNDSVYSPEEEDEVRSMARVEARKLMQGQSGKGIVLNGVGYMVHVLEKTPLGCRSFENSRARVRLLFIDRLYHQYLLDLVKLATCKINPAVYDNINL